MIANLARLLAWLRSRFSRRNAADQWVEPANAITRAVLGLDPLLLADTAPATIAAPTAELPHETAALVESVVGEDEAAAAAFEAARAAALAGAPAPAAAVPDLTPASASAETTTESDGDAERPAARRSEEPADEEPEEEPVEQSAAQAA